jgi:hypothetical protein
LFFQKGAKDIVMKHHRREQEAPKVHEAPEIASIKKTNEK